MSAPKAVDRTAPKTDRVLTCFRIGDSNGTYPIYDSEGARLYPGRWNTPSSPIIYTFQSAPSRGAALSLHAAGVHALQSQEPQAQLLRAQAERLAPSLIAAWPRDTRAAQRCFELLRRAYVDARYSPHYRITPDELGWLIEHVDILQQRVQHACCEKLAAP